MDSPAAAASNRDAHTITIGGTVHMLPSTLTRSQRRMVKKLQARLEERGAALVVVHVIDGDPPLGCVREEYLLVSGLVFTDGPPPGNDRWLGIRGHWFYQREDGDIPDDMRAYSFKALDACRARICREMSARFYHESDLAAALKPWERAACLVALGTDEPFQPIEAVARLVDFADEPLTIVCPPNRRMCGSQNQHSYLRKLQMWARAANLSDLDGCYQYLPWMAVEPMTYVVPLFMPGSGSDDDDDDDNNNKTTRVPLMRDPPPGLIRKPSTPMEEAESVPSSPSSSSQTPTSPMAMTLDDSVPREATGRRKVKPPMPLFTSTQSFFKALQRSSALPVPGLAPNESQTSSSGAPGKERKRKRKDSVVVVAASAAAAAGGISPTMATKKKRVKRCGTPRVNDGTFDTVHGVPNNLTTLFGNLRRVEGGDDDSDDEYQYDRIDD